MIRENALYSGKAKSLYPSERQGELLMVFRDDITAFDGQKKDTLEGKGACNCAVTAHFFELLGRGGVKTHYIGRVDERTLLVRALEMIPLEVIVRNRAAGSLVRNYPFREGQILEPPVIVLDLKDDCRHDPMVNDEIVLALGIASAGELAEMRRIALQVNRILKEYLERLGILLVDFKLEFGRGDGGIVLGDEISMDSMRLWDASTHQSLDKDVYRFGRGDVMKVYEAIAQRITGRACR